MLLKIGILMTFKICCTRFGKIAEKLFGVFTNGEIYFEFLSSESIMHCADYISYNIQNDSVFYCPFCGRRVEVEPK